MQWNSLIKEDSIIQIIEESNSHPVLVFKHSTRCPVSSMALDRLQRSWKSEEMNGLKPYYLDILAYRPVSNKISQEFDVEHESPQILVISNGKCIYNASHMAISYQEVKKRAS